MGGRGLECLCEAEKCLMSRLLCHGLTLRVGCWIKCWRQKWASHLPSKQKENYLMGNYFGRWRRYKCTLCDMPRWYPFPFNLVSYPKMSIGTWALRMPCTALRSFSSTIWRTWDFSRGHLYHYTQCSCRVKFHHINIYYLQQSTKSCNAMMFNKEMRC